MRFGVFLPACVFPGEPPPSLAALRGYAERAEGLGFESLWVLDHLFDAPPSYRVVFLEPITTLALVASATRRMTIGTGILVLPLRDPVVTAKALANLDVATEGRLVFGAGLGWDEREFDACQVRKSTRGRRMDEMLEIIAGLWTEDRFSYRGRIFTIPEVSLLPRPVQQPRPPIWVAGGTVPPGTSVHITARPGYTPERSLRRAARMDGVITAYRASPGLDMSELVRTWGIVQREARAAGRDPASLRFAHQDHFHLDLEPDDRRLREVFARYTFNRYEDTAPLYLTGHPDDVVPRIQARIDAGVDEVLLNPLTPDPRQLDLFARHVRPRLRPRRV
ncbi:MAG: LLM class flavin-dependent oxidoreductase [Candidatus Rokubacteria bacterium]|nr:LLM class flavin-dependent oxidoreductase [Candidatus Rokubacteria bacterium]